LAHKFFRAVGGLQVDAEAMAQMTVAMIVSHGTSSIRDGAHLCHGRHCRTGRGLTLTGKSIQKMERGKDSDERYVDSNQQESKAMEPITMP
jgi:hypothetical protein